MGAIQELEAYVDWACGEHTKRGHYPVQAEKMRREIGTIPTIIKLVVSGDVQGGFKRAIDWGIPEATFEAAVLKFPTSFTPGIVDCAKFRLSIARFRSSRES